MASNKHWIERVEPRQLFSGGAAPMLLPPQGDPVAVVMHGSDFRPVSPPALAAMWAEVIAAPSIPQAQMLSATATPTAAAPSAAQPPMATPAAAAASVNTALTTIARETAPVHAANPSAAVTYAAPTTPLDASSSVPAAGSAFVPGVAAAATWRSAAINASSAWNDLASLVASPFNAASGEPITWLGGHRFAESPLPVVANAAIHEIEQGLAFITTEAEHLFNAGVQNAAIVDALAAIFAGGAFSAWWLDQRDEEPAASQTPAEPFCDRLIGFGRVPH